MILLLPTLLQFEVPRLEIMFDPAVYRNPAKLPEAKDGLALETKLTVGLSRDSAASTGEDPDIVNCLFPRALTVLLKGAGTAVSFAT